MCAACGGVWLDKGELGELKVSASVMDMHRLKPRARRRAPPSSAAVNLRCPACTGTLSAFPLAAVAIDICESCQGLWLDTGELDVALRALDTKTDQGVIDALTGVVREKVAK